MKFTLAQVLLLASTSAYQLFEEKEPLEDELTEDLKIQMRVWAERKLDRYYGEIIEGADRDWRHDVRRQYKRNRDQKRYRMMDKVIKEGHATKKPDHKEDEEELRRSASTRYAEGSPEQVAAARAAAEKYAAARAAAEKYAAGKAYADKYAAAKAAADRKPAAAWDGSKEYPKTTKPWDHRTPSPYDNDYVSTRRAQESLMEDYVDDMTKDLFGWTVEDKMKSMDIRKRYMPVIGQVFGSQELRNYKKFFEDDVEKDPKVQHVLKEAEWAVMDITGGCNRDGCQRGIQGEEIRIRPRRDDKNSRDLSRREREMSEWDGVYIDNEDIINAGEDIEHVWHEFEELMDPKYPLSAKSIKLDAQLRFSPGVQKLIKMFLKDFGIHSEKDLVEAATAIGERVEHDIEMCPHFRRMKLAVERMLRYAMQNLKVSDFPRSLRVPWVNRLVHRLRKIMESKNSPQELERFIVRTVGKAVHELGEYIEEVEKIEQTYNKNGGI